MYSLIDDTIAIILLVYVCNLHLVSGLKLPWTFSYKFSNQ